MIAGKVNYWEVIDGKVYLGIDGKLYDLEDLDTVLDDEYYDKLVNPGGDDAADGTDGTEGTGGTDGTESDGNTDNTEDSTESA